MNQRDSEGHSQLHQRDVVTGPLGELERSLDVAQRGIVGQFAEELQRIYMTASNVVVMFISEDYPRKSWPRHERQSAIARAINERREYILPARFDNTVLPGLDPSLSYPGESTAREAFGPRLNPHGGSHDADGVRAHGAMYVDNGSVDGLAQQPFRFTVGRPMMLEDSHGKQVRATCVGFVGRSTLWECETP